VRQKPLRRLIVSNSLLWWVIGNEQGKTRGFYDGQSDAKREYQTALAELQETNNRLAGAKHEMEREMRINAEEMATLNNDNVLRLCILERLSNNLIPQDKLMRNVEQADAAIVEYRRLQEAVRENKRQQMDLARQQALARGEPISVAHQMSMDRIKRRAQCKTILIFIVVIVFAALVKLITE